MTKLVLGIESSCDDSAVAIVNGSKKVLANVIYSQIAEHEKYGGIVPEVAARNHILKVPSLCDIALQEAGLTMKNINAVAATNGPGLVGGLFVGTMFAKGLAMGSSVPFIAINHLQAHILATRLEHNIDFPFLTLLISGGHSFFSIAHNPMQFQMLGGTLDDALGETFDKVARELGFLSEGGANIEKIAKNGDSNSFKLPMPLMDNSCNFSFSGLKTAAKVLIHAQSNIDDGFKANLAASFQQVVANILVHKINNAISLAESIIKNNKNFVIAGGVASNNFIRAEITKNLTKQGYKLISPSAKLCKDNGAMIAWAGVERLAQEKQINDIDCTIKPRFPLDNL